MDCVDWLTGLGCKNLNTKTTHYITKNIYKIEQERNYQTRRPAKSFWFFSPESVALYTPRAGEKFTQDNLIFPR